ncbi:MAG: monovalent cation/H(+) antiporter subunit G [Phycisphaerae bacterium]|nr:monovalent cation/H(+) antiporter subunit G [Phycisphaerae bacterium]
MGVHHPWITGSLVGVAVLLAILCALGLAIMRDAYQRLHFTTPVVSISSLLIAIAVWLEDGDWQARIKVILIALILCVMNAILSHATARAVRIRNVARWEIKAEEAIPIVDEHGKPKGKIAT